ncbi:uncharacterized protein LOC113121247 [Carassius auratus]|uniref:Uncharacterized protein LOC113121247 n=1 Tax=Carassius auratus TaxID=7957 RepID=A0A6P6RP51_CARAU|nr:uncharacterized protein LOC113121247 [Carassius auratus]
MESHCDEKETSQAFEIRSQASSWKSSQRSSRSSASAAATRARAKAEAARAKASYAEREAAMMRKKAEVEADLYLLQSHKEATAASAEAAIYEAAADIEEGNIAELDHETHSVRTQRTKEYVQKHAVEQNQQQYSGTPILQSSLKNAEPLLCEATVTSPHVYQSYGMEGLKIKQETMDNQRDHGHLSAFQTSPAPSIKAPMFSLPYTSDLANYMVRKEMVSSGLVKFDDHPENYWAWKSSFQDVTKDLGLTAREELDLLTKWLGPESSMQAKRIRSVHAHFPIAGVRMLWQRLEECYGCPEVIENALLRKLEEFPKISNRDGQRLRELGDMLMELESAKSGGHLPGLAILDTARGVNPIIEKLPFNLQERWITHGAKYKEDYRVAFPPFGFFVKFICDQARIRNDPSFLLSMQCYLKQEKFPRVSNKIPVSVRKTEVLTTVPNSKANQPPDPGKQCPIHNKPHPLSKCRGFRGKPLDERKMYLKEQSICFRCCNSTKHIAKECAAAVKCRECNSDRHVSAMHPGSAPWAVESPVTQQEQGGEPEGDILSEVTSKCTEICGKALRPRSCSKICLVDVYPSNSPGKAKRMYVVLDDQSNRSLAKSDFFELFGINGDSFPYTLRTCAGTTKTMGRRADNFIVSSLDGKTQVSLPTLLECNMLPEDRDEIPTPAVAQYFSHLKPMADKIPPYDANAPILLLFGRDILSVHKVREQCNGPGNLPYAQRLDLGWVIVGEVCMGGVHKSETANVFRTNIWQNGRTSFFTPCSKGIQIKEQFGTPNDQYQFCCPVSSCFTDHLGDNVFQRTPEDDKLSLSVEDNIFLEVMNREMYMDESNHWVAPLPFRLPRSPLPNNRDQAMKRLNVLQRTLQRKPEMAKHFVEFMRNLFINQHAEIAPPLQPDEECWYLPIFGVYHPLKPGKIRVVFDSSAQYEGVSLNSILLRGPDLNNKLLGVLMRFRREQIAVTADVEQMFYCFKVREDHQNFLRFLWFKDNDLSKEITEYRMTVHVFGNSPSPAVAIFGMRRAAEFGEDEHGREAKHFVHKNFYVDDGLISVSSAAEAISLLKNTKNMLAESNIKLHKISSNSHQVMEAFPPSERANDLKDLDLSVDPLPLQRSLGLSWNLETDCFTFQVSTVVKPFTRRGILSTVNSLYDPLGFVAPVTMQGKALVRELSSEQFDWDTPLPSDKEAQWKAWTDSLADLKEVQIHRPYVPVSISNTSKREIIIFADASTLAIAAVAYLRVVTTDGQCHIGFVMAKSKLAPYPAHTVPRLELCAAVLAVELAGLIKEELDVDLTAVKFYTDSRIVLGYIYNTSRRFYVYVANRVAQIRHSTKPEQWHHIDSDLNPADLGTRFIPAAILPQTNWFYGPGFLHHPILRETPENESFELVEPEKDQDIRPHVVTFATQTTEQSLGSHRFERFSEWRSLVRSIAMLGHVAKSFSQDRNTGDCVGWHWCNKCLQSERTQAKTSIIKCVQQEHYKDEFKSLEKGEEISQQSALKRLSPFVDTEGLIRVGGRLQSAELSEQEKHPLIIPASQHVATLLVRYYHDRVAHQGRHLTAGAVRSAGLWIVKGTKLINRVIHQCVLCRKLRGRLEEQRMSDLPMDRVKVDPPFTHVGLDVFGPWNIISRRTRGGSAESKRWVVIFSCLSTRAVHLEVIESMSTSSFINALRRFLAVRGPVKHFRSDRGTNFIGACRELKINADDPELKGYLQEQGCVWTFNAPHSSHMGGAWERMIHIARNILDALLLKTGLSRLTHEVLTTLMSEVMAIMNARPLLPISSDPDTLEVLSPAMLLNQKASTVPAPLGDFDIKDLYKKEWRQVQCLADAFWKAWRRDYLATLQVRRKWTEKRRNLEEGDVVLLKDSKVKRSEWPIGLIVKTIPSSDDNVRKVEVKIVREGSAKVYLRPVSEVVLLLPGTSQKDP